MPMLLELFLELRRTVLAFSQRDSAGFPGFPTDLLGTLCSEPAQRGDSRRRTNTAWGRQADLCILDSEDESVAWRKRA